MEACRKDASGNDLSGAVAMSRLSEAKWWAL